MTQPARMQVAQKAYIEDSAGRLLMVHYGASGDHDWDLPGGRVEADEDDLDTALAREIHEETGLKATVGPTLVAYLAVHSATGERALFLIRRVVAEGTLTCAGQVPEDDIAEVAWVPIAEVAGLKLNPCVGSRLTALTPREDT